MQRSQSQQDVLLPVRALSFAILCMHDLIGSLIPALCVRRRELASLQHRCVFLHEPAHLCILRLITSKAHSCTENQAISPQLHQVLLITHDFSRASELIKTTIASAFLHHHVWQLSSPERWPSNPRPSTRRHARHRRTTALLRCSHRPRNQ